jgi:protoheme IX farnesyltransferase
MPEVGVGATRAAVLRDAFALLKPRLNALVLAAGCAGWALVPKTCVPRIAFPAFVLALGFLAGSAAILNMWVERDRDARMRRTRERPLASGRRSPRKAFWAGQILAALGAVVFVAAGDGEGAVLGLGSWAAYLLAYTPLKRRGAWALPVGALCGALPALMGWRSAGGAWDGGAWGLLALGLLWQWPHATAVAGRNARDFTAAGWPLPGGDPQGAVRWALVGACAVGLCCLGLPLLGLGGARFWAAAPGMAALWAAWGFWEARRSVERGAGALFWGSVVFLPAAYALLLWDRWAG